MNEPSLAQDLRPEDNEETQFGRMVKNCRDCMTPKLLLYQYCL